jgi:succinate dehydrogenase/fumarate reductase flavoprotein subunit
MLGNEMLQVHYHAHLDVIVDGQQITVPEYIGIDENAQTITALHTHDTTGILHIEAAEDVPFKLGQAFTEWGQPLTGTQVGPVALGPDKALKLIVNGKEVGGDPAQYVLKAHDEVVVWVGAKDATPQVPSSYPFQPGL